MLTRCMAGLNSYPTLNKTAGHRLFVPRGCECVRNNSPPPCWAVRAVVLSHTRTLTFVAHGIPARGRASLLLVIRLDDIDLAKLLEALHGKSVEPRLRDFPKAALLIPLRVGSPGLAYPCSVRRLVGQTHPKPMPLSASKQDRDLLLVPDAVEPFSRSCVQAEPFVTI